MTSLLSSKPRTIRPCSTSSPPTAARPRSPAPRARRQSLSRAPPPMTRRSRTGSPRNCEIEAPDFRAFGGRLLQALRYGENPHQTAAFYRTPRARPGVATARQLQGKELSYNNINDTDAAYECVGEFDPTAPRPASSSSTPIPAASPRAPISSSAYRKALRLRSDLGLRRHRRAEPHARCGGRARHHRDFHRSDHRAGCRR